MNKRSIAVLAALFLTMASCATSSRADQDVDLLLDTKANIGTQLPALAKNCTLHVPGLSVRKWCFLPNSGVVIFEGRIRMDEADYSLIASTVTVVLDDPNVVTECRVLPWRANDVTEQEYRNKQHLATSAIFTVLRNEDGDYEPVYRATEAGRLALPRQLQREMSNTVLEQLTGHSVQKVAQHCKAEIEQFDAEFTALLSEWHEKLGQWKFSAKYNIQ